MGGEPEPAPLLGDSRRSTSVRAALQQNPWRVATLLSSALDGLEQFLARAGFDLAPWLAVGFAAGIAVWFDLLNQWQWASFVTAFLAITLAVAAFTREDGRFPFLRQAIGGMSLLAAAGCVVVWSKSALVGMPAIKAPWVGTFAAKVIEREEEPADERVRLILAMIEPGANQLIQVRINAPLERDAIGAQEGAMVRVRARLVPPAPPMLPGSYNFARAAWFEGLAATGSGAC